MTPGLASIASNADDRRGSIAATRSHAPARAGRAEMSLPMTSTTNSLSIEGSSSALHTNERRRSPRHTVQVQIEVHEEGCDVPIRAETTDLSRGGCYVELLIPLSLGVRVHATLWLAGYPVVVHGRIATRHPQFGNGILFVEFEGQGEVVLNRYLDGVVA